MLKHALRLTAIVILPAAFFIATNINTKTTHAQKSKRSELSRLTMQLAAADPAEQFAGGEYETAARERFEILRDNVKADPAEVLRVALPQHILDRVPGDMQHFFERRDGLEGEIEVIAECEEHDGRTHYFLRKGEERFQMFFAEEPKTELLTGMQVNLTGVLIGDLIAVESDGVTVDEDYVAGKDGEMVSSAISGEIKVLVMLVNFQNDTRTPYTVSQANNLLFNQANTSSVTRYYQEASYGRSWVAGDTVGWFTLPMNADCSQYTTIANQARQAAANSGINTSAYQKHMIVFPGMSCGWSGLGSVGGRDSWINGSLVLRTTAHELGHTLGLRHSKALNCGSEIIGSNCTILEYGHPVDMLGSGGVTGNFHPYQKERLGWIGTSGSPAVVTATSSGDYLVSANSVNDGNPKALRILKSSSTWYYVEFRKAVGFDSFIANNSNFTNGVLVTQNDATNGANNFLLDMNPATTTFTDAGLVPGRSYTDTSAGFTLTPLSVGASGMMVNVTFGGGPAPTCTLADPTISVSPSATQWLGAGSSVNYSVSVTNNNSSGCSANSFNLSAALPAGWSTVSGTPTISVSPGSSASATVGVKAPAGAAAGFYTAAISAVNSQNGSHSASVNRELAVYSSLGVGVSPDKTNYAPGETVVLTATVSANGSPIAGASVTFTITKPVNGKKNTVSGTAVTSANGTAVYSYRLNKKQDPAGNYAVSAAASSGGISGTGLTNFQVR